jgi:hypothetical protein
MPKEFNYYFCIFLNRHKKTFSSGVSVYVEGRFGVIVKRIPAKPGPCEFCHQVHADARRITHPWGAYSMHEYYSDNCGPWYFASGNTPEDAQKAASGSFEIQVGEWSRCENVRSLEASINYRYRDHSR